MVTIGVIAILTAIVVPSFMGYAEQNRRTTCIANLKAIGQALAIFHDDYGCYPPDATEYLWTPEAVKEYERIYKQSPPTDYRLGTLTGAAYDPSGNPFAPNPSYQYYKPGTEMHGPGPLHALLRGRLWRGAAASHLRPALPAAGRPGLPQQHQRPVA